MVSCAGMGQFIYIPRKFLGLLIALGVLTFAFEAGPATAAAKKHHGHAAHNSSAHRPAVLKVAAHHKGSHKLVAEKAKPVQQAVITTKAHVEAPDFDFQPRIQDAQALAAKQPVLPGD